ncbi:MAG: carbohydrate kinase family protein [Myxococcota bacterium]
MIPSHVVGLGLCVVDHTYLVDALEPARTRLRYRERVVTAGGHIATALRQVAALGCRARVLAAVGDDADGRLVRRALRDAGVGTRGLLLSGRQRTTVAVVLVDRKDGDRHFVVPARGDMESAAPRFDLAAIDGRAVLLLDAHFPSQALRAAQRARKVGARVVADLHRLNDSARALLPHVDHAIVSHEIVEAAGFDGPRDALRWLGERTRDRPVLTQGARGGLWLEGRRFRRYAAHPARVVDTTGAGDVFHGAFVAGMTLGLEFEKCLDLGARAAAVNCTALGGAGRLMTRGGPDSPAPGRAAPASKPARRGR